jgi:hypothetical protein
VRSAAGRRLGLRELAPGVAVTARPQRELLAALRKAGEAPLAEEADGRPRPESPRPVRHAVRAAVDDPTGPAPAANGHPQAGPAERQPAGLADGEPPRPALRANPAAVVARLRGLKDRRPRRAEWEPPDPAAEEPVRG